MIFIYNYNTTQILGSIEPSECIVTTKLQSYPEVTIKIDSEQAKGNLDAIKLKSTVKVPCEYAEDWFLIDKVDYDSDYTTIHGTQITRIADKSVCYYSALTEQKMYSIVASIWNATAGTGVSCKFYNKTVASGKPICLRGYWATDSSGGRYLTGYGSTQVDPDQTADPKWHNMYTPDIKNKTLEEIVEDFVDDFDFNVFYINNCIILSTLQATDFFQWLSTHQDAIYQYKLLNLKNKRLYIPKDFYSDTDCKSCSVDANLDNFVAAICPYYSLEDNDRLEKNSTETMIINSDDDPWWAYNTKYRETYSKDVCRRNAQVNSYKSEIEWNKKFKVQANLYYAGWSSSYAYQIYYTKEISNNNILSASNPIEITLKTIVGEEIQKLTITAVSSSAVTIYLENTSTVIGYYTCTKVSTSTTDYKYNVKVSLVCSLYGGYVSGHAVTAEITTKLDKPSDSTTLYDTFGDSIGTISWENWKEADSGSKTWYIIKEDSSGNTAKIGHMWITCVQFYSDYKALIEADVKAQAQLDVDSYDPSTCLQSVNIDLDVADIQNILMPGDKIRVWMNIFDTAVELQCSSVEYNVLSKRYEKIETGYVRGTLKQLDSNQEKLSRKIRQLEDKN